MANTEFSLRDINDNLLNQYPAIVKLTKVATPNTTVVNRAQVTDFSKDLLPRFGVDRVAVQAIQEVQGEYGPNGERVWKPINDAHDAVRLVGTWENGNTVYGARPFAQNGNGYVEVTFYGTGFNIVTPLTINTSTLTYNLDGGATSSNVWPASTANTLGARGYGANIVVPIVNNLSAGLHTIKLNFTGTELSFAGYEVVNTSSNLQQLPGSSYAGSQRRYASALTTSSPTSGFTNTYGTAGTRGGHVLVYQKADGTIAKDIRYTEIAAAYMSSANHSNEEIIRTHHWREFGAGRNTVNAGQANDDFSSLQSGGSTRAFTLDDGTTTLAGDTVSTPTNEGLACAGSGKFWTLTFVGTGLDFIRSDTNTIAVDQHTVYVDGSSVGTLTGSGVTSQRIQKICSGLPYGTHTVRLNRDAFVNAGILAHHFIVYGPKVPALPSGAIALADYFVMADFVANTVAGIDYIATGVLRKASIREFVYANGTGGTQDWSISFTVGENVAGIRTQTDRQNAYYEYTFFGTGFELREIAASNRSSSIAVQLQSLSTGGSLLSLTSGNFGTAVFSTYGTGVSFSAGTLDINDATPTNGVGFRTSALPLALYKVRFTNNNASSFMTPGSLDIITPIHAPKLNGPFVIENALAIGSCAVRDLRYFGEEQVAKQKNAAQAIGIATGPTTTSGSDTPLTDASLTIKTDGNPVFISFDSIATNNSVGQTTDMLLYVDGVSIPATRRQAMPATGGYRSNVNMSYLIPLEAGIHKIDVHWAVSGGTGTAIGANRVLMAREI